MPEGRTGAAQGRNARGKDGGAAGRKTSEQGQSRKGKECHSRMGRTPRRKSTQQNEEHAEGDPKPSGQPREPPPAPTPAVPSLSSFPSSNYPTPPGGRGFPRPALSCPPELSLPSIRPSHARPGGSRLPSLSPTTAALTQPRGGRPARLYLRGQRRGARRAAVGARCRRIPG